MQKVLFLVVAVSLLSAPALSRAGQGAAGASMEHVFPDETLLATYPLVAKVRIHQITDPTARTNGNPPRLEVEIQELVSGTPKEKILRAIWRPFPHSVDWGVPEKNPIVLKWNKEPNLPPAVQSVWILSGAIRDGVFEIAPRCRYPFNDEKFKWVKKTVTEGKRTLEESRQQAARELAAAVAADQALQKKADLEKLWDVATDVFIGKRSSEAMSPNYYSLTLTVDERLKDARSERGPKEAFLEVAVTAPARKMVENRLHLYRNDPPAYIVFVRAVPGKNFQDYLSNVDKRRFEFVDGDNGLILMTAERLRQLRSFAKGRAAKPAAPGAETAK